MSSKSYNKCCVPNCGSTTGRTHNTHIDVSFHRIPKDPERCALWLKTIGREDIATLGPQYLYKHYLVCSLHFERTMFAGPFKNKSLKSTAIPSLCSANTSDHFPCNEPICILEESDPLAQSMLKTADQPSTSALTQPQFVDVISPNSESPHLYIDVGSQTPPALSNDSPRMRCLKQQVKSLRRQLNIETARSSKKREMGEEDLLDLCRDHFPESLSNFLKIQMTLSNRKSQGYRSSTWYKQFALTIYFLGPKVYRFLRKMFKLPPKGTLFRITTQWDISFGLNKFMFSVIKTKVMTLTKLARECVLCIDEMSMKRFLFYNRTKDQIVGFHETLDKKLYDPAKNMMVLMARGISSKWKQPVGYFFVNNCSGDDLKNIVISAIRKLTSINLIVNAVISDQGQNFSQLVNNLGVTLEKPYFVVDDIKINYMFDVPHLLKSTRNNFFKYNFKFCNGGVRKTYLDQFFEKDANVRICPKLTNEHLNPNGVQKTEVKLAAQVFSYSVSAALNTYIALGGLPPEACHTSDFINKMDQLFDIFNSTKNTGTKKFNRPFAGDDYQVKFLKEMCAEFANVRVTDNLGRDVIGTLRCMKGWQLTITSFLNFFDKVKAKGIHILYTSRINQDCLENFFGSIRKQSGNSRNPTPIQCARAFKKLFALNYFEHSDGANCVDDFDEVLLSLTPEAIQNFNAVVPEKNIFPTLSVDSVDYCNLNFQQKKNLNYVCGYLIKKCLGKHSCDLCLEFSKERQDLREDLLFKAYENGSDDTFGNLRSPPESFVSLIALLENKFCQIFPTLSIQPNVGVSIKQQFQLFHLEHPCPDFPLDYLLSLYVRVRIFYSLKFLNRDISESKQPVKNYKLVNVRHM